MLSQHTSPKGTDIAQRRLPISTVAPGLRLPRHQRRCSRAAGSDNATLLSLPLFPLPSALHPAQAGTLLVFEPRYLELFRAIHASTPPGSEASFGHILASSSAPPALMQHSVGGLPPLGVCATIKSIEELSNGRLQVQYQGVRRFKLLSVDHDTQPYPIAAATWTDDQPPTDPTLQQVVDSLELEVFQLLQQVAKYSKQLAASSSRSSGLLGTSSGEAADSSQQGPGSSSNSGQVLPPSVFTYAPPPPTKRSVSEYLIKAGHPAGGRIATWERMGSVYGDAASKKKLSQDPYQLVRDHVGKERRQEYFSFAAASVLELGLPERLALLECQDTAARLQFVLAAVQPHLQDLLARVSLQQALVNP